MYRSTEWILEAVKPLLLEHNCTLTISDDIVLVGTRVYVKATATIKCGDVSESVTAFAREAEIKKGMDDSQITWSSSSYARKYALNGLFLIDDTKDADTRDTWKEQLDTHKERIDKIQTKEELTEYYKKYAWLGKDFDNYVALHAKKITW